jgi:hypothetical protein
MRILTFAAILSIPALILSIPLASSGAFAQSVGTDEAFGRDGVVGGPTLTPAQKSALYHAVLQQRARATTAAIDPRVGATVSRSLELSDLPSQGDDETVLKYAMVRGDLVVVDPIQMRVVDIIHGSTRP